jgi:acyl carrier protein
MTRDELQTIVAAELRRIAPDIDFADVDQNADLREQFDIDSMDFLNLVIALGKRFALPIPETDYPRMASVSGLVDYLAEKRP